MAPTFVSKNGLRISKALRSAAKLPAKVSAANLKSGGRHRFSPLPGESPLITVRVQILSANDLLAKDKNGFSDPFVVVSVLSRRQQTPVCKKTLNPVYSPKDSTFDFPIYLSLADKLGVLELVLWGKDMLKKDYLGEAALLLEDWFREGDNGLLLDWNDALAFDVPLVSTRSKTDARGSVKIKLGFVKPAHLDANVNFADVYAELVKLSRPSVVSAAPTEGVGTIRSHQAGPGYQDDGLSSDEEDDDEDVYISSPSTPATIDVACPQPIAPLPTMVITEASPSIPPTVPSVAKITTVQKPPSPSFNLPRIFPTKWPTLTPSISDSGTTTPLLSGTPASSATCISRPSSAASKPSKKAKFRKSWGPQKKQDFNLNAENDVLGIVMIEIQGATDLPRLKNMTRTGWDMDPFVVISFGKKVFRTRVIRHSLNPVWEEKLLFDVRRYESNFEVQFAVLDWDKLTSNDHVGDAALNVAELLNEAPKIDDETGIYDPVHEDLPMKEFKLPLAMAKDISWDSKHNPVLSFRAKYQPYDALRQQFWRHYLKQYDADDHGTISHVELTSMLDSLGSTLSRQTIDSFYARYGRRPQEDSITIPEAVRCLEAEICRPASERKKVDFNHDDDTTPNTPSGLGGYSGLFLDKLDFSGPKLHIPSNDEPLPLEEVASSGERSDHSPPPGDIMRHPSASSEDADESGGSSMIDDARERVINVKNCPLCHRPRLSSKVEMDIVTHLAICASQDWNRVDKIVVGNFVTASQAQRKWYTRVISKVSNGNYRLGANSANIIVQNRLTGQLEEEKMAVYVRLGIRLLYKGALSRMEGARARSLLKSLSVKQGIKYDSPDSAKDIPAFVEFHHLDVKEILQPLDSFKTFNEFFYRKLKPDVRPVESPDDPYRLVSGADCRLMTFESVSDATRLWIKGREFSVARLLGEAHAKQVERYLGVDGTIGPMRSISGEYYTVNPQAIRTTLDVYGENVRKIVPIESPQFGRVMAVCIGAMMVGSIKTTVQEGQEVKRGSEFGYFAFGGSTIVLLFEKGMVEWDEDLLINTRASLETLVRVGMGIGRGQKAT